MTRMYEVPIKWVFRGGERQAAFVYVRQGQALMRMLENHMSYRNLQQGVLRRRVRPDVLIECDKRFGLRTVTITTVPIVVRKEEQVEQSIFPLLVAVSDSTGIKLYGATQWNGNFKYEAPLYGYYEEIPDGYNFGSAYRGTSSRLTFSSSQTEDVLSRAVDASLDSTTGWDNMITRIYLAPAYSNMLLWDRPSSYYSQSVNSSPTGCNWCKPVLMPWANKKIISSFVTRYGGENVEQGDLPGGYQYYDAMLLADIGLGRHDLHGHGYARSTAWRRGVSAYAFGDVGPVIPLPAHNGVRRYVIPRWGGEAFRESSVDPILFRVTSIRGEDDVRDIAFTAGLLAAHVPDWLHTCLSASTQRNPYFQVVGCWAHADENTGEVIVHMVLLFNDNRYIVVGEGEYGEEMGYLFEDGGEVRQWGMCMCRFVVPAPIPDATPTDEETALLDGTRVENMVTAQQFLPLLDSVLWANRSQLYYGGAGGNLDHFLEFSVDDSLGPNSPVVLYAMPENTTLNPHVNYTIGDETYSYPDGYPYNINDNTVRILWDHAFYLGLLLFARGKIDDQKALFQLGDTAYSWTRHFGGIALGPDGMAPQPMTWPAIINNDVRTRPNVTYAGGGVWCCVCERMGEQVLGVFFGTPFSEDGGDAAWWREIPLVTAEWAAVEGNRIVHVRPLLVTTERAVFLAIVRERAEEDGQVVYFYRFAFCDGTPSTETPEATHLRMLGKIQLEHEDEGMSWDMCIMDHKDKYAQMMLKYPTPPVADVASSYNKVDAMYRVTIEGG